MGPWISLWSRGLKPTETPKLQVSTVIEPVVHSMNPRDGIQYKSSIIISQCEHVANMALGITCSLCRSNWKSWCVAGCQLVKNISDLLDCWIKNPFTNNSKNKKTTKFFIQWLIIVLQSTDKWFIYLQLIAPIKVTTLSKRCCMRKWY